MQLNEKNVIDSGNKSSNVRNESPVIARCKITEAFHHDQGDQNARVFDMDAEYKDATSTCIMPEVLCIKYRRTQISQGIYSKPRDKSNVTQSLACAGRLKETAIAIEKGSELISACKRMEDAIKAACQPKSPCSPHSFTTNEAPMKPDEPFLSVNPSITLTEHPSTIMKQLEKLLKRSQCNIQKTCPFSFKVSCLYAAEEILYSIQLYKVISKIPRKHSVEFGLLKGDENIFLTLCDEFFQILEQPLNEKGQQLNLEWNEPREGRKFAISKKTCETLIEELNSDLHPDTMYEIVREVKNHCRHAGNRTLFVQVNQAKWIESLQWMLSNTTDIARFGVYILLQYAQSPDTKSVVNIFASIFEKNTIKLYLKMLLTRGTDESCRYTQEMAQQLLNSRLFSP